jgi:hypothetical protein
MGSRAARMTAPGSRAATTTSAVAAATAKPIRASAP